MKCVLYMVIIIGSHYYKLQLLIMKNLKAYFLCNIPSTFLFLTPIPSPPPSFLLFLLRNNTITRAFQGRFAIVCSCAKQFKKLSVSHGAWRNPFNLKLAL